MIIDETHRGEKTKLDPEVRHVWFVCKGLAGVTPGVMTYRNSIHCEKVEQFMFNLEQKLSK